MEMTGQETIAAPRDAVWAALNEPEILRRCIPGCQTLEKTDDTHLAATVAFKVGPVSARFSGTVELANLNPPASYTIVGEGKGGPAGFAKGSADVTLSADGPAATTLSYAVKAEIGGKLAQLGSRLVDATARKLAGEFFAAFARELAPPAPEAIATATSIAAAEAPAGDAWFGLPIPVVIAGGVVIALVIGARLFGG